RPMPPHSRSADQGHMPFAFPVLQGMAVMPGITQIVDQYRGRKHVTVHHAVPGNLRVRDLQQSSSPAIVQRQMESFQFAIELRGPFIVDAIAIRGEGVGDEEWTKAVPGEDL